MVGLWGEQTLTAQQRESEQVANMDVSVMKDNQLYFAVRRSDGTLLGQIGVATNGIEWWPFNARRARTVSWETLGRLLEEHDENNGP